MMTFITIPMRSEIVLYCARIESNVVSVPVPAMSGNANGTTDAVFAATSSRDKRMPKIISNAMKKITSEPAMAKSLVSKPMSSKIDSPAKRNTTIMASETSDALPDCNSPDVCRKLIMTGIEPIISITAKSTIVTVAISLRSIFIYNCNDGKIK